MLKYILLLLEDANVESMVKFVADRFYNEDGESFSKKEAYQLVLGFLDRFPKRFHTTAMLYGWLSRDKGYRTKKEKKGMGSFATSSFVPKIKSRLKGFLRDKF